jgi:hypothetical protein
VDQVGRKSETTLRIASLHVETAAFAAAAADKLEPPTGASDARHRQCRRRQRVDAPARDGSRGLDERVRMVRDALPPHAEESGETANGDIDGPGILCGQLQTAGHRLWQANALYLLEKFSRA